MKKKILVIDDKLSFRKLVSVVLSKKYEVVTAQNGYQALALIQQGFFPDAVVSDLMMPKLDGENFTKQLRSSGLFHDIPVIILSSIDKSARRIELIEAGADDYVTKPVNPAELEVRLERLLKQKMRYKN